MSFFSALEILSAGFGAERVRMDITASNLANARTTRTPEGGPYRRRDPVFAAGPVDTGDIFASELQNVLRSVEVTEIVTGPTAPHILYDPGHPDADGDGYVAMPNISIVEEMVNMITAARSYEAGVAAMRAFVEMAQRSLKLGR